MLKKKKKKAPCIPESILSYITYQILQGLIKLHNLSYDVNIFHNDLKEENIFLKIKNKDMKNELENISHIKYYKDYYIYIKKSILFIEI